MNYNNAYAAKEASAALVPDRNDDNVIVLQIDLGEDPGWPGAPNVTLTIVIPREEIPGGFERVREQIKKQLLDSRMLSDEQRLHTKFHTERIARQVWNILVVRGLNERQVN